MADEATTGTEQTNPPAGSTQPNAEGTQPQAGASDAGAKPAEGQGSKASSEDGAKAGEAKPADTKPDGDAKGGDGKQADTGSAPESYEAFTVPDGFSLEGERLTKFQELAKASGWTQEQAQAVITDFTANVQEDMASKHAKLTETWAEQLKADPAFGGQSYETNLAIAGQAVSRFGGQELIDVLNELGIGNHPVLARTFLKIGKATSEGSVPGLGSASAGAPKSLAERMYPSMAKK